MRDFEIKDFRNKKIPTISVLISFYKDKKTLKKSIQSILKQTFKNFEIILLSDGGDNEINQIAQKFINKKNNILFIASKKNLGLTKMLNIGLKYSRGLYLARHDADDISLSKRFKNQVGFLNKNNHIDILGSNAIYIYKNIKKQVIMPELDDQIKKKLPYRNTIIHSSVMMKKKILTKNFYNEKFRRCQDYDLWLRLKNQVKFHNLQQNLIIRSNTHKKFLISELVISARTRFENCGKIISLIALIKDILSFSLRIFRLN